MNNPIRRFNRFVLFVSIVMMSTSVMAEEWIYTVRAGDNLWNLTERHLTSMRYVKRLQKLNRIENPYAIPPGTQFVYQFLGRNGIFIP